MKNAGYEIIRRKHLTDNFDAVIGYDPENPIPYVCWLYNKDGDTYGYGTYYKELRDFDYRYPESRQMQDAYENACDCIAAGIPMKDWNDCGLEFEQLLSVWNRAVKDVGKISMV